MRQAAAVVLMVGLILEMVFFFRMFLRGAAGHSTRPSGRLVGAASVLLVILMAAAIVAFLT